MRSALICPDCIRRIELKKLSKQQAGFLEDLKSILNDLGSASKWNTDIIDYWRNKKASGSKAPDEGTNIIRDQVFISYSHQDAGWLRKLKTHLKPQLRDEQIVVWDDTKLTTGQD